MVEPLIGGAMPLALSPGGSLSNYGSSLKTYLICSYKPHFHPHNDTFCVHIHMSVCMFVPAHMRLDRGQVSGAFFSHFLP